MLTLIQLPPELVSTILSFVDPEDLPRVNLTCKYLYHTVRDNAALFRDVYLNNLVSLLARPPGPALLCPLRTVVLLIGMGQ